MFVAETREEAVAIARPHVEWLYRDRAALGHSQELPDADRIDVGFEQVLDGRFIIGSPAECIEEIKKYQALGVDELVLRCQWPRYAQRRLFKGGGTVRERGPAGVQAGLIDNPNDACDSFDVLNLAYYPLLYRKVSTHNAWE